MKRWICWALALLAALCVGCAGQEQPVRILFINVGKADAALIAVENEYYMVDTGTKDSASAMLQALSAMGVKEQIAGVFITHSHSDHMGGLEKLSESCSVEAVYRAEFGEANSKGVNKVQKRADKLELSCTVLSAGDALKLAEEVWFEVLGPLDYNDEDDNDNSLVLMLHAYGKKILFTGDMQFPEEESLMKAGADLEADVLKVGNHGNPDATGDDFALAVSPKIAVISTDRGEDKDSANQRVLDALYMAKAYITENSSRGILLTIDADGGMICSEW